MTEQEGSARPEASSTDAQARRSYDESRERQFQSAIHIRLFGIRLAHARNIPSHIAILYCGFNGDGIDYRECSERIWHLPINGILSNGKVDDFTCHDVGVEYFDLAKDATPVEEQYIPISLGLLVRDALKTQPGVTAPQTGVFAARIGDTISPSGQMLSAMAMIGGGGLGGRPGLGVKYITGNTSWMWTKEAFDRSRYDPVNDPDEVEMFA